MIARRLLATFVLLSSASSGVAFNLSIPKPTHVAVVLSIVSIQGRFNVLVSPDVQSRLQITHQAKTAAELLEIVVRQCNLVATRYAVDGGPDTYVVTSPGVAVPPALPQARTSSDPLDIDLVSGTPLSDLAEMVGKLGGIRIEVDPSLAARKVVFCARGIPAEAFLYAVAAAMSVRVTVTSAQGVKAFRLEPAGSR
jgi:hypothetical protein